MSESCKPNEDKVLPPDSASCEPSTVPRFPSTTPTLGFPAIGRRVTTATASNPIYTRLKNGGITSTAYSYGIIGSAGCAAEDGYWDPNSLIGVSQVGNTITIISYSLDGNSDSATPRDQITYTKK